MSSEVKWGISAVAGAGLLYAGWKLPFLLTAIYVLLCFLLIVVVLLQSGKAADLAGAFGGAGSQTAFGPRGTATFLSKATTWCAIMFMLTSFALVLRQERAGPATDRSIFQGAPTAPAKQQPASPQPVPAVPAPPSQSPTQPSQQPPAQGQAPQQSPPTKLPAKP